MNTDYGLEIWSLYEAGELYPDYPLTGTFDRDSASVDVSDLLEVIEDVREEEQERQRREQEQDEEDRDISQ